MCLNFGLMAIIGILSALAADLFVTPILVSKCKVFGKEKNKTASPPALPRREGAGEPMESHS